MPHTEHTREGVKEPGTLSSPENPERRKKGKRRSGIWVIPNRQGPENYAMLASQNRISRKKRAATKKGGCRLKKARRWVHLSFLSIRTREIEKREDGARNVLQGKFLEEGDSGSQEKKQEPAFEGVSFEVLFEQVRTKKKSRWTLGSKNGENLRRSKELTEKFIELHFDQIIRERANAKDRFVGKGGRTSEAKT